MHQVNRPPMPRRSNRFEDVILVLSVLDFIASVFLFLSSLLVALCSWPIIIVVLITIMVVRQVLPQGMRSLVLSLLFSLSSLYISYYLLSDNSIWTHIVLIFSIGLIILIIILVLYLAFASPSRRNRNPPRRGARPYRNPRSRI